MRSFPRKPERPSGMDGCCQDDETFLAIGTTDINVELMYQSHCPHASTTISTCITHAQLRHLLLIMDTCPLLDEETESITITPNLTVTASEDGLRLWMKHSSLVAECFLTRGMVQQTAVAIEAELS